MELAQRICKIEVAIATLATKEDLVREVSGLRSEMHKEFTVQTWKIFGLMLSICALLTSVVYFLARHVK
jgi:hypothetical protein